MQASADQYVRITELCKVSQKSTTQNLIIYAVLPGQPSLLLIQVFRKKTSQVFMLNMDMIFIILLYVSSYVAGDSEFYLFQNL